MGVDVDALFMYELVMRKPPSEEPKIHSFARWW